jgi:hypothetical protein
MPLDICPGAQRLRAQLARAARSLPSARLRDFRAAEYGSPLDVHMHRCVADSSCEGCDCALRLRRVYVALEAMAAVEAEREEATTEADFAADVELMEQRGRDCIERDEVPDNGDRCRLCRGQLMQGDDTLCADCASD